MSEDVTSEHEAGEAEVPECIFCSIVAGVTPSEMVWQDEHTYFFRDISPKARVHVIGIPKKHIASLAAITEEYDDVVGQLLHNMAKVADTLGIRESGYRVATNVGRDAGQDVKHLHWHLLGGEPLGPLRC